MKITDHVKQWIHDLLLKYFTPEKIASRLDLEGKITLIMRVCIVTFIMTLSEEIEDVVYKLNHRPRKTRGYKTPHELFTGQSEILVAA